MSINLLDDKLIETTAGKTAGGSLTPKDRAELLLEAWKKTVDVQQHFNDMEMRIRNLALTIMGAAVAFARAIDLGSGHTDHPTNPGYLFLALTVLVGAFWFMDRHWYHRLLLGSVLEGAELEKRLTELNIPIGLGSKITSSSSLVICSRPLRSTQKLDSFYLVLGTLSLSAVGGSFGGVCIWLIVVLGLGALWWCALHGWWSGVHANAVRDGGGMA
jgi:hypothetical protein